MLFPALKRIPSTILPKVACAACAAVAGLTEHPCFPAEVLHSLAFHRGFITLPETNSPPRCPEIGIFGPPQKGN